MEDQFGQNQIELGGSNNMESETSFEISDNLFLINKCNIINSGVSNNLSLTDPKIQPDKPTKSRLYQLSWHSYSIDVL